MTHSLRDLNDKNDPQYDKGRLTEFYSDPEKVVSALNLISLFAFRMEGQIKFRFPLLLVLIFPWIHFSFFLDTFSNKNIIFEDQYF